MKINLIIGAGQLGSRHLQGMLQWTGRQKIYVLDPFEESLKTASLRAGEIEHTTEIIFISKFDEVPENLDLVIVATQSNIREQVVTDLLGKHKVEFLILEKVLFQDEDAFHRVKKLLKGTKTWVNHPRRMFDFYVNLANSKHFEKGNKIYHVNGNNWGLACNGLHFIDLFTFLSKSKVKSIQTDWLDKEIQTSKRNGYIEFTGTLKGELLNGDKFIISSFNKELSSVLVNVSFDNQQISIVESSENVEDFSTKENDRIELHMFEIKYQSYLTSKICENLFEKGTLSLPTYEEAMDSHLPFITTLLEFYNSKLQMEN